MGCKTRSIFGRALGSIWTEKISRWILKYSETGQIEQMKMNWWHKSYSCTLSSAASMKEERKALDIDNVAGLFVILLVGLCLAVVLAVIEFCIKNRENAQLDRVSLNFLIDKVGTLRNSLTIFCNAPNKNCTPFAR